MNNTNLNFNLERNQRPTAMGSKNYLFSKNDSGAVDNAIFHTLLWSWDIVGVNPQEWLTHVLNNLHDDAPPDQATDTILLQKISRITLVRFFSP